MCLVIAGLLQFQCGDLRFKCPIIYIFVIGQLQHAHMGNPNKCKGIYRFVYCIKLLIKFNV